MYIGSIGAPSQVLIILDPAGLAYSKYQLTKSFTPLHFLTVTLSLTKSLTLSLNFLKYRNAFREYIPLFNSIYIRRISTLFEDTFRVC